MAKMLADDVIEPSTSPWVSPIVVVPKKDGSLRPCVDMRKVNEVTKAIRYPLGHIQDILDSVGPAGGTQRFYSTLDLKSGYWQVPMADAESKERTAFATPTAQYQYKRMPMGLKGAAAVFAALMRKVLGPVLDEPPDDPTAGAGAARVRRERCAVVYLDDILVFSNTLEEHVRHLQQVFDLLRMANLRVAVNKCEFAKRKVVFLGHLLDGIGGTVAPSPRNVATIAAIPSLRTVRQVRAFLGSVGYYRAKVPGFGLIARPLHRLLRKNAAWRWTSEEEEAFQELKATLMREPIVRAPDFRRPFIIQVDWCRLAVAACLAQRDDEGQEYAVQFASKAMSGPQLHYSSADGEAFAAVWAIKHFHPYVYGSRFTLVTDSMAVRYLRTASTRDLHGKLARYAIKLQPYDFEIIHKAGLRNSNVDGLSRLGHLIPSSDGEGPDPLAGYELEDAAPEFEEYTLVLPLDFPLLSADIQTDQEDLGGRAAGCQPTPRIITTAAGNWELADASGQAPWNAIKEAHELAHWGIGKTYDFLQKRYYWEGMKEDVRIFIRDCQKCLAGKHKLLRSHPLRPLPVVPLWGRVHIDLAGPYKTTRRRNRFVILCVDAWSKWPEVGALPNKSAATTARWLWQNWITRFGSPTYLVSDRGGEWEGEFQELLDNQRIQHRRTASYTPQSNGQV
ncbi:hypothetical protein GPECTOR_59g657 [Gonium pectorale]|uniref:Integrase catalytic domain-containing protein n=1 Tax=Gonium pectorale TaxID=33097 RepID=A0A150G590_GONPE|nr:hypothetical protein GPECTOR_59g657 [Gonium pectorale]|eukprot:KXZ45049.1 hypothetical protein GPECTOR_59g657 [Gonium pectorale]